MDLQEKVKSFPEAPGVYLMKGRAGEVLYVGKAASLRKRVLSYFRPGQHHPSRVAHLLGQVAEIDFLVTRSEAEALLYEASLIKTKKPKYNVALRDDKSYPWIKLSHEPFPRIFITRQKKDDGAEYFGPYTDATLLRVALASMRRNFPLRNCRVLPKKPCLDYYIGQCKAPCAGFIDEKAYAEIVREARLFLEGRREALLQSLAKKMQGLSEGRHYEEAAKIRDDIQALSGVSQGEQRPGWLEGLSALQELLKLERLPRRIEAFDISNVFGASACGSMVSFVDGLPDKDGYRRFRIKEVSGINDYEMMREVIRRRYLRVKREGLPLPDLIVIDGGRGHLGTAHTELKRQELEISAIGIAKRFERIYRVGRKEPIELPKSSKALHFIQRIRDEAHRFAIEYHHLLQTKTQIHSFLERIPGIGPRRRQELLVHFQTLDDLRKASVGEFLSVRGITPALAASLKEALRRQIG